VIDGEDEDELRAEALANAHAARVLADAYEADGQLSRAAAWRAHALSPRESLDGGPPDLYARRTRKTQRVDRRRSAMIWLLRTGANHRYVTRPILANYFGISTQQIRKYEHLGWHQIRCAANQEVRAPTMRATQRLLEAGALAELSPFLEDVELPPDNWPRERSWVRMRTARGWVSFDARHDIGFPESEPRR
jgi:hypothetical protein